MNIVPYIPAGLLVGGAALTLALGTPHPTPLTQPLSGAAPVQFLGVQGSDVALDPEEEQRSGVTTYLNRAYDVGAESGPMLLYLGYHATQQGDHRLHSPSLCLPGVGWVPVLSDVVPIAMSERIVHVNRYILQKDEHRILVYYWFQGRGHITAGETAVKIRTLVDALVSRRDEETLARIVVPIPKGIAMDASVGNTSLPADTLATRFAASVIPALERVLPAPP